MKDAYEHTNELKAMTIPQLKSHLAELEDKFQNSTSILRLAVSRHIFKAKAELDKRLSLTGK